jgi:hypothetical protein
MIINGFTVTATTFEPVDDFSCHLELDGMLRLVWLKDTEFETINDLKIAVDALIITPK